MDLSIIEYQFSVNYPVQMHLTFAMDSSSTIIDLHDANMTLRNLNSETIFNFGVRIYSNFHLITTAQITTDPLANALLASSRCFKITDVTLRKDLR